MTLKEAPSLLIRPLARRDEEAARTVINEGLGSGTRKGGIDEENPDSLWLGAFEGQELVGVSHALVLPLAQLDIPETLLSFCGVKAHESVGLLKTMVVIPRMRGRGIGAELARLRIAWLSLRVAHAFSVSWHHAGAATGAGLLKRMGFSELALLNSPFARESLTLGIHCPACGPPPCGCAGALFWLRLP